MDDLARFFALERRLIERLSTRIEPFDYGTAFFDEKNRQRYSSNFLLVDSSREAVTAEALMSAADEILGGSGYEHRQIDVENDQLGGRLSTELAKHSYKVERNVIMVQRRQPDRQSDLDVDELTFAEVKPLREETYRRRPWAKSEEVVQSFTEEHGKYERVIGARFFAVSFEGSLAGCCELYVDGLDAQVEFVDTLEEFRGRGVARAVVLRAAAAARTAGAKHVFIVADEDDWPKDLYARLGFDRIGRTWQFARWAEGDEPSDPERS
jgi:N-acetylglutamate synthase-like GNAT family acetyltransferase